MRRRTFRIPDEGEEQEITARRYAQLAWPEGALSQIDTLFEQGRVEADGMLVTRPDRPLAANTTVTIEPDAEGERTYGVPEVEALLRGEQWVVVDKPAGIPGRIAGDDPTDPIRFMADVLGLDRSGVEPVWQTPASAVGPWLLALDEDTARRLGEEITEGRIQTSWQAIVTRPARSQGRWEGAGGHVDFAVTRTHGELAEVQLQPKWKEVDDTTQLYFHLLAMLAEAGFPAVGDAVHGGYLVPGDLRLRLGAMYGTDEFANSWPAPRQWWPEQPVVRPVVAPSEELVGEPKAEIGELKVPRRVLDALEERRHPWVMHDPAMAVEELRPGRRVQLIGPDGPGEVYVLVDGTGPVATRVWSTSREEAEDFAGEVSIRLDEAIGRRRSLFRNMDTTDVFRIVHGEADGLPGLVMDRLGPVVRVALVGRCARAYGDIVYERLAELDPAATVLEVVAHRQSTGNNAVRVVQRGGSTPARDEPVILRERGLRFRVDPRRPFEAEWSADHRENRRLAEERAERRQRWLSAVPDGGSFAVALARAGVATTQVHPSEETAERMDNTFELNGLSVDLRNNVVGDLAGYLEGTEQEFQGMAVEVPATGNVAEVGSLESLLERCWAALEPGGWLLFARRGKGGEPLVERVEHWADQQGHAVAALEPAAPAEDFPRLDGFAEGDTFDGVWMRLEA